MNTLQEFMLLFRFNPNTDYQPSEAELQEQHKHWETFIGGIASQAKLVSTHQLGFEGKQIQTNLDIEDGINVSENKTLGGNMIVKAKSLDDAIHMAKQCPILQIGGTVQVRNIIPMQ